MAGPALLVIHHTPKILASALDWRFEPQTVLTLFVPYLVSTYATAMTELANHRPGLRKGPASA